MTNGTAPGSRTNRARCHGVAASDVISSACTGATARSPRAVATNTGTITTTVDDQPARDLGGRAEHRGEHRGERDDRHGARREHHRRRQLRDQPRRRREQRQHQPERGTRRRSPTSALPPVTAAVERITGELRRRPARRWRWARAAGTRAPDAATTTTCHTTRTRTPSTTGRPAHPLPARLVTGAALPQRLADRGDRREERRRLADVLDVVGLQLGSAAARVGAPRRSR